MCLVGIVFCSPVANAARKDKAKEASAPFALIAGTVFRPPGFALPGAEVTSRPNSRKRAVKAEEIGGGYGCRGELAVRVPPVPANWRVDVKINGYRPAAEVCLG